MTDNQINTIGEKLKKHFNDIGITQEEAAKRLNVSQANISALLNKKPFGKKLAQKWGEEFGIQPSWLLTGEGEMLKPTKKEEKLTEPEEVITSSGNYKLVPLYNMDARGGFGANDEVDCTEYVVDLIPFKDAKDKDICVPVSGKSMMPTFCPGTVVLLHEIENWIEFLETGQIYVLILKDGRRLIKELRRSEEDRQANYLCVSHNPDYEPVELPRKLIHRVYMVTAMYQKTSI